MTEATTSQLKTRVRGRPFKKGQIGNPKGRTPGSRHHATVLAEQLMRTDVPDIVRAVIESAKSGDMVAAKLVLERIVPLRRGAPVQLDLPKVNCARDVVEAAAAITAEVAAGSISPDEGTALAAVVDFQRRAIETADLEVRLHALEEKMDRDGTS